MVCNHVPLKLTRSNLNLKRTLRSVKAQLVSPQYPKDIPEVINMLRFYLTLYHHIIYVNLNVFS